MYLNNELQSIRTDFGIKSSPIFSQSCPKSSPSRDIFKIPPIDAYTFQKSLNQITLFTIITMR